MGSKGSVQTTSNTTSAPDATAAAAYRDVLQRAQTAANTPYQAYGGQQVADLNSTQQSAFNTINGAQGAYQPFLNSASGYATAGASPITSADLARYQNPYQQQVIDATMANINENNGQQRTALTGNAISQGAFGGDRAGIAQAELARQQNLTSNATFAGLNSQNYTQALGAAQADRSAAQTGASQFSGLAGQSMSLPLQGAQAQLAAGNQQQAQSQSQLNVPYQQWQQQQAYPYAQTQWLAGINTGVGSQLGGTSNNVGTQPAPNQTAQYLGAGLSAASFFLKNGGAVPAFAGGGSTSGISLPMTYEGGWIPKIGITAGHGAPQASGAPMQQQQSQSNVGKTIGDAVSFAGKIRDSRADPGSFDRPLAGLTSADYDPSGADVFANGGDVLAAVRNPRGGIFLPQRFAGGGAPMDVMNGDPAWENPDIGTGYSAGMAPAASFADRFGSLPAARQNLPFQDAYFSANGVSPAAFAGNPDGQPFRLDGTMDRSGPMPKKPIVAEDDSEDDGTAPKAPYAPTAGVAGSRAMSFAPTEAAPDVPERRPSAFDVEEGHWLSPAGKNALLATGLGLMASRSPYLGVALGEGGQQGLATYGATKKGEAEAQQAADKLSLEAKKSAADLALRTRAQVETERYHKSEQAAGYKPTYGVIGEDPTTGQKRYGWIDPNTQKVTPDTSAPVRAPAVDANGAPLEGDAYLKSLPPEQQAIVKKIAHYEISPSSLSIKGGHREQLLAAASRYNPEFDAVTYPARAAAVRSFGSGPKGDTIRSLDVAIDHLGSLETAANAMQNGNMQLFNSIRNKYREQTGSELPGNFDAMRGVVGDEIVKAVVGSKGALGDREEVKKIIENKKSPEQIAGFIRSYKQLMAGQLHGLKKQYEDTTGLKNFESRLRPATLQELEAATHKTSDGTGAAASTKHARVKQNGIEYKLGPDGNYTPVQ